MILQHNFAHDMAAWLLCDVQNFVTVTSLEFVWQQNESIIEFKLH